MSPPRLTGALRSFSTVTKQEDFTPEIYDLKSKRLKRQEIFSQEGLTWQKIVHFLNQRVEKKDQPLITQELRTILQAAKQIVGTDFGQDTIESAGVFLFKTFHNKEQVGHEETRAIKQMFGPFPASAAELSCAAVGRLVAQTGECHVEAFIQKQTSLKSVDHSAVFGRNIVFSFDTYVLDAQDTVPWTGGSDMDVDINFHNFINQHVGEHSAGVERDNAYSVGDLVQRKTGSSILREEVEKYLNDGNMVSSSAEELSTSLFEMLASTRSDDELQNELFEFLGPEGFEMISVLLQTRSDIVDSVVSAPSDSRPHFTSVHTHRPWQSRTTTLRTTALLEPRKSQKSQNKVS